MIIYSEIIKRDYFYMEDGFHPLDALLIILSGSFEYSINKVKSIVNPGEICVFPKNVHFKRKIISPIRCIYIQLDSFPQKILPGVLPSSDPNRLKSSLNYLEKAVENKNNKEVQHYLNDIFLTCGNELPISSKADPIMYNCLIYLETHFAENISLDFLAKKFGFTKQGFIYKFKKQFGKTPVACLNEIRLENGKKLLMHTDYTVECIANMCGYENMYYFSNTFKKYTGISPGRFRASSVL